MAAARPEMQSLRAELHANAAQVSQIHGTLAAQMMFRHADLRAQVFQALTPAQQTEFARLEAETRPQRLRGSSGAAF